MNGTIKIAGTNSITEYLKDKVFEKSSLKAEGKIHYLILNEQKYLFDIKTTYVMENSILFVGVISDDASYAGNIAVEFFPEIA